MVKGQGSSSNVPAIYESHPPEWLPSTSNAVDIGFQSFYPPRPNQDEDALTESHIKAGYQPSKPIQAEAFTSKAIIIKTLKDDDYVPEIEDFMNQILRRREENLPPIPTSSFRAPSRVTLNDAKRQTWFADLANPDVPLHKLGKSIPHGVRGNDLLDLLHANNVAVSRAVWFVRVLGFNETAAVRTKPGYNPLQYSVDWANVMTGYLRKQLSEIILPSLPRAGLNIKQSFKGVLSDPETREKWLSKFSYSLDLLRVFYVEHMVDHSTFLSWLVQFLSCCNLAQAGFVARLAEIYLDDMFGCRALTKLLIEACLVKLNEISAGPSKETLLQLQERLRDLLRRTFHATPHAFIFPRVWSTHSELLRSIFLLENMDLTGKEAHIQRKLLELQFELDSEFRDIELRNEALLFRSPPQPTEGCLRSAVADVQLLNAITPSIDLNGVNFFGMQSETDDELFTRKLDTLLAWCVSPLQYGCHRPYAAVTLLRLWRDKAEERALRRNVQSPTERIQYELFNWLDSSDLAKEAGIVDSISLLFGELVENGLFSYDAYIQRLIARGESGLSFLEEPGSRHRLLLRTIPLHRSTTALVNQRKLALYGVRARQVPEDAIEKEIRQDLRALLPEVFGGALPSQEVQLAIFDRLTARTLSRYEQIRVVKQWLLPALRNYLSRVDAGLVVDNVRLFSIAVEIFETLKCYRSMLEIALEAIKMSSSNDLLVVVVDTLRRHMDLWACMNVMSEITQAACAAHHTLKTRGAHVRPLVALILDMDDGRFLDGITRQHILEDAAHYAQALCPIDDLPDPVPSALPEILLLAQDMNPEAPSMLANSLWYRYRTSQGWTWTVWDNVIASLRQVPTLMPALCDRNTCALRYAKFLLHIDEHSADGIDTHALRWFLGSGYNEIIVLAQDAWDVALVVFMHLAISGALRITTLLHGVVYRGWLCGASVESPERWQTVKLFVRAANTLAWSLLLQERETLCGGVGSCQLPPYNLTDSQRLKARRSEVYLEAQFAQLVNSLPTLVFIQNNLMLEEQYRSDARAILDAIVCFSDFNLATSRYFEAVLATFEKALDTSSEHDSLHNDLMSALHQIFNNDEIMDRTEHSARISSILSPWKLSATCALTKFDLKQIGKRMNDESTREQADLELTQLVERLLHSNISAEEADFIIDMTRGVGCAVAEKFLNNALHRIADLLEETQSLEPNALETMTAKAGHFLKLLTSIVSPLKTGVPSSTPRVCENVQQALLPKLFSKLQSIEGALRELNQDGETRLCELPAITTPMLFLARLLHFDLGFFGVWTPEMRHIGNQMLPTVIRLASYFGGGLFVDRIVFTLLIDTAFYIFDELPIETRQSLIDAKTCSMDIFVHCPADDSTLLPDSMPLEFQELVRSLFRHSTNDYPTSFLVYATRNAEGHVQRGSPVQMRPWEWIEYLGDPPPDPKDEKDGAQAKRTIRNNSSLSLDLFDAHVTGERIRHSNELDGPPTWLFEDNLYSESIYERDWREGRIDQRADTDSEAAESGSNVKSERRSTPFRSSPALSSRLSLGGPSSGASSRQSPALDRPAGHDFTDSAVSALSAATGKRKASAAALMDPDEGGSGLAADQGAAKKGKGKIAAKTRSKRR